jgi:hypothetical protein
MFAVLLFCLTFMTIIYFAETTAGNWVASPRPFPIMLVKLVAYYAHSNACYFLKLCSNYAHFSKLCSFGCKKCSALIRRNGYNRSAKAQQHVLFDCFRAICAGGGLFPASLVLPWVACNHRVSTYRDFSKFRHLWCQRKPFFWKMRHVLN